MCIDDAEKYVEWFCDSKTADGIGKSGGILSIKSKGASPMQHLEQLSGYYIF